MKQYLLTVSLSVLFTIGMSFQTMACDFSPSVNANNLVDNGDGTFTFDVLMCVGERGSENGPTIYLSDGINILSTTSPDLMNPATGLVTNGAIVGGILSYTFPLAPIFWVDDDGEFGPCFSFSLTVDADPSAATVSFEDINDNCFNDISGGVWSTGINTPTACSADYSVVAPFYVEGNTLGAGNDCDFRPSEDQIIEVEVPCPGVWNFSLCDSTAWDTYIFLSTDCCSGEFFENDDNCGAQSEITTYLPAGTYYITIEGFHDYNGGDFGLLIEEGTPLYKAETGPDQNICETSTFITGNEPIMGTGLWTVLTGNGNIVSPNSNTTEVTDLSNGVNQFIWTLGDGACEFDSDTITVIAAGNLTITCPSDETVNNDPGECSAVVTYPDPVGSSECSPVTITQIEGLGSGATFPVGATIEKYLVADTLGNVDSCSFVITVVDTELPTITCPGDINLENDEGLCSAYIEYTTPTGDDNCPNATVVQTTGLPSGSDFPVGATVNTFEITDASGNVESCTFTVTITDTEAPVFTCPDDLVVEIDPGECDAVVNFSIPTATDNCPGMGAVTQTEGLLPGDVFPVGTTTQSYEVTDANGNTATCSFDITVIEPVDPEITCPGDLVFEVTPGTCGHLAVYVPPVGTDNCPGATTALIQGLGPGEIFPVGETTEVYEVTDASGNTAQCSFTITVIDTIAPQITCPSDINLNNDPGICGAEVTYTTPTGSDNCPSHTVTMTEGLASGEIFPVGTTTVTYVVEDASGNTATCSFEVTIIDVEDPLPDCEDITVSTDPGMCSAVVNYDEPTATDNCGDSNVIIDLVSGPVSGSEFPIGLTQVVYSFADEAGNTKQCSINILVEDNEDPVLTCPDDITIVLPESDCDVVIAYDVPVGTDNCPGVTTSLISGPAPGDLLVAGEYTVTYEAEDAAGNTETCSFDITIVETVAPIITCPDDIVVYTDESSCSAEVTYTEPVGTDNCPGATTDQTAGLGSGATFPVGETTETYTVTDLSGNTESCSFTITVLDTISPVITCPSDIEVDANTGECTAIVSYPNATATDNCDGDPAIELISGPASGSEFVVGVTTIVFEATDESGNTTTCSFTVTVNGETEPSITCPGDLVVSTNADSCGAVVDYPLPTAEDACGGDITLEMLAGLDPGSYFPLGTTTIEYSATNTFGETVTCSFDVTVVDDVNPVITCPEDIEIIANATTCEYDVAFDMPTATDNCGIASLTQTEGDPSGSTLGIGTHVITFEATDDAGNVASCSFNIIITDTLAPTITSCPTDISVEADADNCGAIVEYELPEATDNCEVSLSLTTGIASGELFPVGETTVTYTATDLSGNTAECSFTVTVTDNIAPVITCPEDITTCDPVVNYSYDASDNCEIETVTVTDGLVSGSEFPAGTTEVTITVTDASGNSASCSFTVTVEDDIDPVIVCPEDIVSCEPVVNYTYEASDNCEIESVTASDGWVSGSEFPTGTTEVTLTATDVFGNTASCSFTVTIENDNVADAGPDQVLCGETSTTLEGNTPEFGFGYWEIAEGTGTLSDVTDPNAILENLEPGTVTLIWNVASESECPPAVDQVQIFVEGDAGLDAGEDVTISGGESTQLEATVTNDLGGTYSWEPETGLSCTDCPNPVASPSSTTTYTVTYTSEDGCEYTDQVTVKVFTTIPTGFTPDGDGQNDVWNIPNVTANTEVIIYNRWGNEIYESVGYNKPWDGTYNNKPLPMGSYYYVIDYRDGTEPLNGVITLIR